MMQLRIHRTWTWERDPDENKRLGGWPPVFRLVSHDVLEQLPSEWPLATEWQPIPVVEDQKPEHPQVTYDREQSQNVVDVLKAAFANAKNR